MNLPPLDAPGLLRRYGLRPDKRLGQNFLIDQAALQAVTAAAAIQPGDSVLEIGPGLGSLTRCLAAQASRVVAVELDGDLLPPLREALQPFDNVEIIQGDILALNPASLMPASGYLVVANIPYYITSALIRHLLESAHRPQRPQRLVLTVQNEVARRICAQPGELSLLALSVQVYGAPRRLTVIPANAFYPAPKVDSAVVRVDLFPEARFPAAQLNLFFRLAKAGFSQKRKTLRNALAGGMRWSPSEAQVHLENAGIDPQRRAETLSLEEWERLVEEVS
ncbi:MAG: 16S rRNA (adenine(1518)-N(6)/adenine(1519)-N(6))-dimethyltransferase RsmA [Chloroflexota bacterium]